MAITKASRTTKQAQPQQHTNPTGEAVHVPPQSGVAAEPTAQPTISVVIPTLNEARNLEHVFAAFPAGLHEVILVDGHSDRKSVV